MITMLTMRNQVMTTKPTAAMNRMFIRLFVCFWHNSPQWGRPSSFTRFTDHTHRHITICGTPLDERSARRRNFHLTTHNTHKRQTSMPLVGFELTISAGERPYTYALDSAATGTGNELNGLWEMY